MKATSHRWYVFRRLKQSGNPYSVAGPYETQAEAALALMGIARDLPGGEFTVADVLFASECKGRITVEEAQKRPEPVLATMDYQWVECPGCGARTALWTRGLGAHTCKNCGVRFSGEERRKHICPAPEGTPTEAVSSPGSAKGHKIVRLPEGMSYEREETAMKKGDPEGPTAKGQQERRMAAAMEGAGEDFTTPSEMILRFPPKPPLREEVDALKERIEEVCLNGEILAERLDQRDVMKLKLAQRIEALEADSAGFTQELKTLGREITTVSKDVAEAVREIEELKTLGGVPLLERIEALERGAKAQGQALLSFLRRLEVVERTTGDDYLQSDVSTLDARLEAGDRTIEEAKSDNAAYWNERQAQEDVMDADCERMARREELLAVAREVLVALIESGVVDKGRCPREAVRLALDLVRAVEEAV